MWVDQLALSSIEIEDFLFKDSESDEEEPQRDETSETENDQHVKHEEVEEEAYEKMVSRSSFNTISTN